MVQHNDSTFFVVIIRKKFIRVFKIENDMDSKMIWIPTLANFDQIKRRVFRQEGVLTSSIVSTTTMAYMGMRSWLE